MTIKEKTLFKTQVKYELKVYQSKVKNLEYILQLLEEKEEKEENETRKSRNKDKYIS